MNIKLNCLSFICEILHHTIQSAYLSHNFLLLNLDNSNQINIVMKALEGLHYLDSWLFGTKWKHSPDQRRASETFHLWQLNTQQTGFWEEMALTSSKSPVKITDWFSYRLSITFNPAGCGRVQGREPVGTNMQHRKREHEIEGFRAAI